MGKARVRKERFLKEHPYCCFCGGKTPASEEDHVPGRTFFRNRQWPEGYVFPACSTCNDATRYEEKVVSLLARLGVNELEKEDFDEFLALAEDIGKHDAHFFHDFKEKTSREIRTFFRDRGLPKPSGTLYKDIPLLGFGKEVDTVVRKYSRKVLLALWYMHTGKILPASGGLRIVWMTNASASPSDEELDKLFSTLAHSPRLVRSRKLLEDQFTYRFAITDDFEGGGFLVWFRDSFGLLGLVTTDRNQLPEENTESPFEHVHPPF